MSIFSKIAVKKPDSNRFKMPHDVKFSFKMGELVPHFCMETLPGDKITINPATLMRFAPLISPVMHKVKIQTHFFFVPNRILWSGWEDFITDREDILPPTLVMPQVRQGRVCDYFGLPTGNYGFLPGGGLEVSAFPFAAYAKIFDEYYRDQNLQAERFKPLVAGSGNTADYLPIANADPFLRNWTRDYFTACLPFAQAGEAVQIPLTFQDDIPVEWQQRPGGQNQNTGFWRRASDGTVQADSAEIKNGPGPTPLQGGTIIDSEFVSYDPNGTLRVDVQSEATDINTLRWAFRIQEYLEKNARAGRRYVENLLAHWGVKSSDARLQRPEFIGSTSGLMTISEVLSTADNLETGTPVGQMAGHGVSASGGNTFSYHCEEHGFIIGIVSVMPVSAYQQGVHRMWTRKDHLDYANPIFANLGEQPVLNKEVYAFHPQPDGEFGYIPRFSEYKFLNSRVAGEMRTSLAFWHMGRIFQSAPALNEDFIQCDPSEFDRVFAVTAPDADNIYAHAVFEVLATRKLPRYGIPSI